MLKLVLSFLFISGGFAHAQTSTAPQSRLQNLERRVQQLQNLTLNLERRLDDLEYNQGSPRPPRYGEPPRASSYSAIIIDTGYSKTFLGTAGSKLEAEAMARQACAKVVNAAYCNGAVRIGQPEPGARGAYCVLTDTGYSKTFSAHGADLIEAEAKAKQSCQAIVNAAYCGNAVPRCESTN